MLKSVFILSSLILSVNLNPNYSPSKCISELLKKYCQSGETFPGSVVSIILGQNSTNLQEEFLKTINSDIGLDSSFIVKNVEKFVDVDFESFEKPQCYFTFLDSADEDGELESALEEWKSEPTWNPTAQFVLFLNNYEENNSDDVITQLATICLQSNVLNVNIIHRVGNVFEAKSVFPYDNENFCGTFANKIESLDSCEVSETGEAVVREVRRAMFVDKFPNDMQGCPLTAYARVWEPYTFYNEEEGFYAGIDYVLMKTIAEHLNCSFQVVLHNRTLYHIFQKLIESTIEMVIGGIDEDPNISNYVSGTVPYYQDELTWCVAKAERTFHWLNFITSFTPSFWFLIYLTIVASTLGIVFIHFVLKEHIRTPLIFSHILYDVMGACHSQSLRVKYPQPSIRLILSGVFILALIMNTAYQAILVGSLTQPSNQYQVRSVQEFPENSIRISGNVEVIRHLNKKSKLFEYLRQNFEMCYFIEDCLKRAVADPNLAVMVSRQHSFYNPRIPRDKLYCFDREQNIYSYFVSILTPKNYHLLKKFNPLIQQLIESGHIIKWAQDLDNERVLKDVVRGRGEGNRQRLNIKQMQGPFIMLAILLFVALNVFVVELVVFRVRMGRMKTAYLS